MCGFRSDRNIPRAIRKTALSFWSPPVEAAHLSGGAGLVDEDQLRRIEIALPFEPRLSGGLYVGPLLFGGMRRLFLNVIRRRSKKRHSIPTPALTPRACSFS
jgi:hypothetical protein